MRTVEAARGRWGEIFSLYGLPPITGKKHYKGECPLCGKREKFRIDDKEGSGSYICVCSSGGGFQLLVGYTGKDFATLAKEVDEIIGNKPDLSGRPRSPVCGRQQRAIELFSQAVPIKGTDAQTYLNNRGIFELPRGGVKYGEVNGKKCLIALASTPFSEPVMMHLTFLEGGHKVEVDGTTRKMHGLKKDSHEPIAIKLQDADTCLGIAEGIETALSAHQLHKLPVWSVINATYMKKFRAPPGVKNLYIYADNDRNFTGKAAAFECGRANLLSKNDVEKVVIRWPATVGDFNDVLLDGIKVLELEGGK